MATKERELDELQVQLVATSQSHSDKMTEMDSALEKLTAEIGSCQKQLSETDEAMALIVKEKGSLELELQKIKYTGKEELKSTSHNLSKIIAEKDSEIEKLSSEVTSMREQTVLLNSNQVSML